MRELPNDFRSIPGVCDVAVYRPAGAPKGWLLIEVPHGATRRSDYDAVVGKLKSTLPEHLEHFFFVNTDIGAPEGAAWLGEALAQQGLATVVTRCLIPRTFIDTNRLIAATTKGVVVDGLTPAVPGYVEDAGDAEWLTAQHTAYHRLVEQAYALVCGEAKGLALQLHSFSPRSVGIEKTDHDIVKALHAAYVPEVYAKWPERPQVDCICATPDKSFQSAPRLVAALRAAYGEVGIKAEENATYSLHPATMGFFYAKAYPDRVLCVEWNRGLVADPFVPFGVSPISPMKVAKMAAPLATVLGQALGR